MTLNRVSLGRAVAFMKYLASVASIIFLAKTLIWNKITFSTLNSLDLAKMMAYDPKKSIYKRITNIPFSIRFITA